LGDICELKYGKALAAKVRVPGEVPVFGSNGQVGTHCATLTSGPTIVVGRKGSFGEVNYSEVGCWPIDTTYFVDGTATDQDLRWLHHVLPSLRLTELSRAAAVPGLSREDAYRRELLLPPIEEQRRIAAILDQAESIRAGNEGTQLALAALAHAFYLSDGRIEDAPTLALAELCAAPGDIKCGPFGTQLKSSEFRTAGVPLWGIKQVNRGFQAPTPEHVDAATAARLSAFDIVPGDIVMTRKGTVGNCAVYPEHFPQGIMHSDLLRIRVDTNLVLPAFLSHQLHHSRAVNAQLARQSAGAVMPGLNVTKLKMLSVRVPDMAVQREFVHATRSVGVTQDKVQRRGVALATLFSSLQARAFSGRL